MTTASGWFKSSRSPEHADCVEVNLGDQVGVRDTKDRAAGHLTVSPRAWTALVVAVRQV